MFNTDLGTMTSTSSTGLALIEHYEISNKEYALKQMVNPFRFLLFWDKDVKAAKASALEIKKFQLGLLHSYRAEKTPEEIEKDPSILGHLVRAAYPSDTERCADMTTFILAGHDTTAYSLAWTMIEVARNPEVYQKLKKEIDSISPGDERITVSQMNNMSYLDCVLKESMRLWPVASSGISREMSKDIPFNDYIIPKGSVVLFPFICTFRNGIEVCDA
jgi:cytochrome P450